jgi:deazaflavin-dependent oxidoreductase (nitroreductase family)
MTTSGPPRTRLQRAVARAPILLFRLGLGGLLGRRFVLLTHVGQRTGLPRRTVLEIVGRDDGGYLVASGYGAGAQWFRNVRAEPQVRFQVGWRRYRGLAEPLPPAESGRRLAAYAQRHPHAAAALMRMLGHRIDGSPADYEQLGADPEHGIPIVALRPAG